MKHEYSAAALMLVTAFSQALADDVPRADSHAPIGVMGDHFHKRGEWMLSYRYMSMRMAGNLDGSDAIDPDTIATTVPNRFFGMPMQPPTLRIVPVDMDMEMHMLGLMYAPSDRVTLMLMSNYITKEMNHITYAGPAGTDVGGEFRTRTSGLGDTSLTALVSFHDDDMHRVHAIAGLSLPTGSTDEVDGILAPTGMRPTVRVPYPMQLGSGSVDPIVGLSYSGTGARLGWGAQWRSTFRVSDNDDDYRLGDEHRLTAWTSYLFSDPLSASLRLECYSRGNIDGQDPSIMGPVQTADPDRQGIDRLDLGVGLNWAGQGDLRGWRLGLEFVVPLQQDLDGPQLETDEQLTLGLQRSF